MTKTKECKNCWFYCHMDGRCYVDPRSAYDDNYALRVVMAQPCTDWAFDGLSDWEREEMEALVTMDSRQNWTKKIQKGEITIDEAEMEYQDYMHRDEGWREW